MVRRTSSRDWNLTTESKNRRNKLNMIRQQSASRLSRIYGQTSLIRKRPFQNQEKLLEKIKWQKRWKIIFRNLRIILCLLGMSFHGYYTADEYFNYPVTSSVTMRSEPVVQDANLQRLLQDQPGQDEESIPIEQSVQP